VTVIPYEPPDREFTDTMLAFRDFDLASTWSVSIEPDPLGPVNNIVTLMRGRRRIKSALLAVTDAEMQPPRAPAPRVPLWRRMPQVLREQVRADADWIAGRLGYHRDERCTGWDE
jgi:hypothetical protein